VLSLSVDLLVTWVRSPIAMQEINLRACFDILMMHQRMRMLCIAFLSSLVLSLAVNCSSAVPFTASLSLVTIRSAMVCGSFLANVEQIAAAWDSWLTSTIQSDA
jgi:hypothetical protein